jgi:peptide/nickel transport system substrate-binding protein
VLERSPGRGLRDWSNTSVFGDPVAGILRAYGQNTEAERTGEWVNEDLNKAASALEVETDMARRRALFRQILTTLERDDPGYITLHHAAAFTAKRRNIEWRASSGWAMMFGPGNLRVGA